jgi:hypothetical protein
MSYEDHTELDWWQVAEKPGSTIAYGKVIINDMLWPRYNEGRWLAFW